MYINCKKLGGQYERERWLDKISQSGVAISFHDCSWRLFPHTSNTVTISSLFTCLLVCQTMETHYEIKDKKHTSMSTRQFNLEAEHAKMMKQLDIDNYTLSRIPRPGESLEEDKKL